MKRIFAAAIFALLIAAAPARAATITWYLNAEPDFAYGLQGETVTGFFDWDTLTNTPTDWSFTEKGPLNGSYSCNAPCPFTEALGTVSIDAISFTVPLGFDQQGHALGAQGISLVLSGPVIELDDPTKVFSLLYGSTLPVSSNPVFNTRGIDGTVSATPPDVPSPVPLPASLPLFGTGVLALAGLAWRTGKVSA